MNNMQVNIWQEQVSIPTYHTGKPDRNPMFFENRVYQGSSGVVYPNPVIEKIEDEKVDQLYNGLFLENKYLKIMILPELGGRVHMAFDKVANRHFIYYNQVIKPALVGLCGPWISGGIEFNWPQHHRPSTFDPIDYTIEENEDGSKTVWVNEIEKMFHTKGMAGFTLHPDKAFLEIKAQLYNRTNLPQTFLWWANPAVRVNDHYQSVFPPDVNAVFDHGKRDVSSFPIATGTYYKVDYSPGTDISRYKNIPVPTSYMAVNSDYNFVGGYEHDTQAGVLHVADHHISPGKKQWTWGNGDFGVAWDRNLTDEDGPYIELMTGVFTDNQPDFSWLMPYEEKAFTQYFLPYREVGLVKNATKDLLVGWTRSDGNLIIKVFSTSSKNNLTIILKLGDQIMLEEHFDISPEKLYINTVAFENEVDENTLQLFINDAEDSELIRYIPATNKTNDIPEAAKPALQPAEIKNTEQLFLTGQHLEQYRHATYSPIPYYEEALRRDALDIRNNNALGLWYLRKGKFNKSEDFFRIAIAAATKRNPNPYDSEPYYNLGLALSYQGKVDEAYNAFFKATWSSAFQDMAYFSIARVDVQRNAFELGLEHINWSIDKNSRNGKAYLIKVHILRKLNRVEEAIQVANSALKRDRFNLSVLFELHFCYLDLGRNKEAVDLIGNFKSLSRGVAHNLIEYAIDYAELGLYESAVAILLTDYIKNEKDLLINYYLSFYNNKMGNMERSFLSHEIALKADKNNCFPNRLEDINVLQFIQETFPADGAAYYCLGNLWYDKKQYTDAIECWQRAATIDMQFPTVFRNLAIAAYNKQKDTSKALKLFEKAYSLNPADARVLMELDQLYKRLNFTPETRLEHLSANFDVAVERDDVYLELAAIHNFIGTFSKAHELIMARKFHPWEGGEGKASGQYIYSLVELAKIDLLNKQFNKAIQKLELAQIYPVNLGEGKLPGAQENDIFYWLGCAYKELHDEENARLNWEKATIGLAEPSAAIFYNDQQPDKILYQGLAWEKLGNHEVAATIFQNLLTYGKAHLNDDVKVDYFAVSLPDLLIFEDDLKKRNNIHCNYISGLGYFGLQQFKEAEILFAEVLHYDAMHFGAKTHMSLLAGMKNESAAAE